MTNANHHAVDPQMYRQMHEAARQRYWDVTDAVFEHLAEGDVLGLLEVVADIANGCDYVDDDSIALFNRAKQRWAEFAPTS